MPASIKNEIEVVLCDLLNIAHLGTILSEKIRLFSIYGFMVYLSARPEDRALMESNLSARWGKQTDGQEKKGRASTLPIRSIIL